MTKDDEMDAMTAAERKLGALALRFWLCAFTMSCGGSSSVNAFVTVRRAMERNDLAKHADHVYCVERARHIDNLQLQLERLFWNEDASQT